LFDLEKPVSTSLELVLFASSWRDDCCWWLIKVSFAVLLLFSSVGLGELGSRSLLPVIGWTYRFDALFWLCTTVPARVDAAPPKKYFGFAFPHQRRTLEISIYTNPAGFLNHKPPKSSWASSARFSAMQ